MELQQHLVAARRSCSMTHLKSVTHIFTWQSVSLLLLLAADKTKVNNNNTDTHLYVKAVYAHPEGWENTTITTLITTSPCKHDLWPPNIQTVPIQRQKQTKPSLMTIQLTIWQNSLQYQNSLEFTCVFLTGSVKSCLSSLSYSKELWVKPKYSVAGRNTRK